MSNHLATSSVNYEASDLDSGMIDWAAIRSQGSAAKAAIIAEQEARKCLDRFGTLPLEELLRNRPFGGQIMIEAMDERNRYRQPLGTYRLKVLRLPDGQAAKPGARWLQKCGQKDHYYDESGERRAMTTKMFATLKRLSQRKGDRYDPILWREHVLDSECCISVDYYVAMELLCNWSRWSIYPEERWCFQQHLELPQPTLELKGDEPPRVRTAR